MATVIDRRYRELGPQQAGTADEQGLVELVPPNVRGRGPTAIYYWASQERRPTVRERERGQLPAGEPPALLVAIPAVTGRRYRELGAAPPC